MVDTDELKRRSWRQTAVSLPILAALLFAPAGTLRYWQGWLYAFVFIAGCVVAWATRVSGSARASGRASIKRRLTATPGNGGLAGGAIGTRRGE